MRTHRSLKDQWFAWFESLSKMSRRRRYTFLVLVFLGLLTIFNVITHKENKKKPDYGFERPTAENENDEAEETNEKNDEFDPRILSQSIIEKKLRSLGEQFERLRSAPEQPLNIVPQNNSLFEVLFHPDKVKQREICARYYAEGHMNRTVILSPWEALNRYDPDDVSMVVHMTVGKMDVLDLLLSFWPGPMSIVIDIKISQIETFLFKLSSTYKHWVMRDNLDFHFVRNDGMYYPVNFLRDIGLKNVKTRYVFLNDIDFIPPAKLYRELRKMRNTLDMSKTVYVVPAFEFLTLPETIPQTKKQLFKEWEVGKVQPFHYQPNSRFGHNATEYRKWITAKQPYQITWGMYYEPYILAEAKYLPSYETRYLGRYMDKISFIDRLAATGFKFLVLPNLFIIHFIHPVHLDVSYLKCAEDLYHDIYLPEMISLYLERGVKPPKQLYTRGKKPPEENSREETTGGDQQFN